MKRTLAAFIIVVAALFGMGNSQAQVPPNCYVTPNPAAIGSTVMFHADGLWGTNYLVVSGLPYRYIELGNAKSVDIPVTVDQYSMLFSVQRDDNSGNYQNKPSYYKCSVTLGLN